MTTLTRASSEWASRPDDQRFLNLFDLDAHMRNVRQNSRAITAPVNALKAIPNVEDGGLYFVGGKNKPATMSNWAFSQLCQTVSKATGSFPSGFIQSLPAPIAADVVNHGLSQMDNEQGKAQLLLTRPDDLSDELAIRSINSPTYGRIWNHQITQALVERFGDGRTGDFRVPGEFGKAVDITKANTTIYGSDRDMFVFLCDEEHKVTVKNRRNGEDGHLSRGFFVWNSEVGAATLGVATFLFDYVCSNRIVWGATEYKEVKMKHSLKAPERFLDEVSPMLTTMMLAKASTEENIFKLAQDKKIGDDTDREKLYKSLGINPKTGRLIDATHKAEEDRPIETLWDMQVGITAFAKTIPYQSERVAMEKTGGMVLDLVAN